MSTRTRFAYTLGMLIFAVVSTASAESDRLQRVLAAQADSVQTRYPYRHPRQTLEFFGVNPGMTVLEVLPGQGWYTRILLDYLGPQGHLVGVDYSLDMFRLFGFFNEKMLKDKETWSETWTAKTNTWRSDESATVSAYTLGTIPESAAGTADAILFIRAMHHLARFESEGGYLTRALADALTVLKPGGIVGIVQHEARPDMPDDWADGSRGYLKKSFVIEQATKAGLEFVGESDVNSNAKDHPGANDVVWRLPPTLRTSKDDPELRAQMEEIGESHRMTLKFRKPD